MVKKKKKESTIHFILLIAAMIASLYIIINYVSLSPEYEDGPGRKVCPYKTEGNANASLVIKYIDSPYCFWCMIEDGVLKKVLAKKGDSFRLERYDIRYCKDIVNMYEFSGTPSFVFSMENGTKEYTQSGFIREDVFYMVICKATGDCYIE